LNDAARKAVETFGGFIHAWESFANLFIAAEADIFIGTRTSNWCRLIDEHRKVMGKVSTNYYSPANDKYFEWSGSDPVTFLDSAEQLQEIQQEE